jgi:hypothetical protein
MLSIWRRKPEPVAAIEQGPSEPVQRNCQQNIKVSEDCSAAFAALARTLGVSKAALFEDMVAKRLAMAERQGVKLKIG